MFPLPSPGSTVGSIRQLITAAPRGETRWFAAEDVAEELLGPNGFRLNEWRSAGWLETVKSGPHRTVYRVRLASGCYYLKHYRCCDWKAMLQNVVRPPKAVREWNAAREVAAAGVPTFDTVAVGRMVVSGLARDSFLASRAIPDAEPLDAFVSARLGELTRGRQAAIRQRLARELGRLAATLHRGHFLHRDLHAGNVLIRLDGEDSIRLWVIDLHAVGRCRRLTLRRIERGLALLNPFFARHATAADRTRFFRSYWSALQAPPDERTAPPSGVPASSGRCAERRIADYCRRDLAKTTRRRDAKWSRGNRRLIIADAQDVCCRGLALLGPSLLRAIRDDPESLFTGDACKKVVGISEHAGELSRCERSQRVSRNEDATRRVAFCQLTCGGRTIDCRAEGVDGPHPGGWWKSFASRLWPARQYQYSSVRRAWEVGHAFLRRGIRTARPLAFVEVDSQNSQKTTRRYLLTERIPDATTLDEYLRRSSGNRPQPAGRRHLSEIASRLADALREIRAAGFDHRSLSGETILVSQHGAPPQFWFVSLENVRRRRRVTEGQIAEALGGLNHSLLSVEPIRLSDRLRFLKRYLRDRPTKDWKTMWRAVQRRTDLAGPSRSTGNAENAQVEHVERLRRKSA